MNLNQDQDKVIEGHDYDGIRELDNSLPLWWLAIFFGTIIFAFIYYIHYESGAGALPSEELARSMAQLQALHKGGPVASEEKLAAAFTHEAIEDGRKIFVAKCSPCHGPNAEGLIGPNLTDRHWIHGSGTRVDILQVISQGVPEKGMPAWAEQLTEQDLMRVAGYVHSIKGTFVSGGKPPQGNEFP